MDYQTFQRELAILLERRLGESYTVSLDTLRKNNDVCTEVITVKKAGSRTIPAVHLAPLYARLQGGSSLAQIADTLLQYLRSSGELRLPAALFDDWTQVKDRIVCRLVGAARNRERLETLAHRRTLDLAEIYYYMLDSETSQSDPVTAGIAVQESYLAHWGITADTLREAAAANTARLCPPSFQRMRSVMEQLAAQEFPSLSKQAFADLSRCEEPALYVLSNRQRLHGAWWMCDPNTLQRVHQLLGESFFLIPSSVHECLVLPESAGLPAADLAGIVREINRTQVAPEEVLTDSVYRCTEAGTLTIAAFETQ